jgi:hypothetical protein
MHFFEPNNKTDGGFTCVAHLYILYLTRLLAFSFLPFAICYLSTADIYSAAQECDASKAK